MIVGEVPELAEEEGSPPESELATVSWKRSHHAKILRDDFRNSSEGVSGFAEGSVLLEFLRGSVELSSEGFSEVICIVVFVAIGHFTSVGMPERWRPVNSTRVSETSCLISNFPMRLPWSSEDSLKSFLRS